MADAGIVDGFLNAFSGYIDSGFGLLRGEVAFLSSTLIAIDLTLAGLFWAWGADDDILQRLTKKTLFIGVFAYLLGNFNLLAGIVFNSFAGLGLRASGSGMPLATFLQPSWIAHAGLDAARPVLSAIGDIALSGGLLLALAQAIVLLFAYCIIVIAFFVLSVQLFVTLVEFKLTSLAGFVLLPFGLFGKTAFLAEKVLGNVVSSGVKVLVLAVIIGIGGGLFGQMTNGFGTTPPTSDEALSIALGALTLLGLGMFGPGIANGLIAGGPQLGAGSALGTAALAGGMGVAGAAGGAMAVRAAGATVTGAAKGGAALAGGTATAYGVGAAGKSGVGAVAGGIGGVARAGAGAAASPLRRAADSARASMRDHYQAGSRTAFEATGGAIVGQGERTASAGSSPPDWAQRMNRRQSFDHGVRTAGHAAHASDRGGSGSQVELPKEDK